MDNDLLNGFYLEATLVEPLTGQYTGPDGSGHLPSRAIEVLLCLARRPRRLVPRDQILAQVWGEGRGSSEALNHAVSDLRHAFADDASDPRVIQTVPRRGYRLLIVPRLQTSTTPVHDPPLSTPAGRNSFWRSMVRHGVVQATAAYLIAGWLIIQVADATFEVLGLPAWALPAVTFAVIGGIPVVILLSWFLEIAEGKMIRDRGNQPDGWLRGLERNYLAIVVAYGLAVFGVGVYQLLVGFAEPRTATAAVQQDAALLPVDDNAIAVLKFVNLDGSRTTQDFSEGLSEDLLDRLASLPGLYVAARGDAWSLPPNATSSSVRRRLRVAYFLEGSVRLVGDEIRVVAQLIDSKTGFHIVSRSFQRKLQDFMAVQSEITELIVSNLRSALPDVEQGLPALGMEHTVLTAYLAYRRGQDALYRPTTKENAEEALGHFDKALVIDPGFAAANAGRCRAYIALYDIEHDIAHVASAEAACRAALASNARLPMVHDAVGQLALATGRYADAEAAFLAALDLNRQDARALRGLAEVLQRGQRFEEAEQLYRQAIRLQPGNWRAINMLGNFLFRIGRYADAADQYRRVVFLNPDNFVVQSNLGSAQIMAGEFDAARRTIESSLELHPDDTAYSNLGIIYYYLGDFEKAVATHRKAIDASPYSYLSWLNLGDALQFAGDEAGSQEAFRRAIELGQERLAINPADAEAMYSLAWAEQNIGNPDTAQRLLRKAAAIDSEDPYLYYYRSLIEISLKDYDAAAGSLEKAIEHGYPKGMLTAEPYLREFLKIGNYATQLGIRARL